MQAHGVGRCLVQDQGEAIELHHLMEPAGQLVEQRGQIAVRRRSLPKRPARLGTGRQWQLPVRRSERLSWRKPRRERHLERIPGGPLDRDAPDSFKLTPRSAGGPTPADHLPPGLLRCALRDDGVRRAAGSSPTPTSITEHRCISRSRVTPVRRRLAAQHLRPLLERQVRRHDHATPLVRRADHVEEQLRPEAFADAGGEELVALLSRSLAACIGSSPRRPPRHHGPAPTGHALCGIEPPASVFDDTRIKMNSILRMENLYAAHGGQPVVRAESGGRRVHRTCRQSLSDRINPTGCPP